MMRIAKYVWLCLVLSATGWLPDLRPVLRFRGWLTRPAFKHCGKRFEIAGGVRIVYSANVEIGDDVYIATGCWIQGYGGVSLGNEVMLGPYTVLASNNHMKKNGSYRFGGHEPAPIALGRGAWTGAHVVIAAGVRVGKGAAVAAGAVVTRDVPDDALVGGVPARIIRDAAS
ncbi:MAG: acyltransferase [Planctomycetes bacterium]|nr:acyltransferase [Planctomycetota bacterium]